MSNKKITKTQRSDEAGSIFCGIFFMILFILSTMV